MRHELMPFALAGILLACPGCAGSPAGAPTAEGETDRRQPAANAYALRNAGIAELENEQPARAEAAFRQLAQVKPNDPLPHADLAIALFRQQKSDEALAAIGRALKLAPGRPDLLAIQAEILNWTGREAEALKLLEQAGQRAPEDLEILYALYRVASTLDAAEPAGKALAALARLRPENVVVLSQLGQRAIAAGDRAAATGAYRRLGELTWQGPPAVAQALDKVEEALAAGDPAAARVPALRLENVLKVTPMYQQSLRELSTGIQGIPVTRFADEPPRVDFGEPVAVRFAGTRLDATATAGGALGTGDLDGDSRPDVARLIATGDGTALELRLSRGGAKPRRLAAGAGLDSLLVADLDNDGRLDLIAHGPGGVAFFQGQQAGAFAAATDRVGLAGAAGTAAAVIDFDIEGDLDLVLVPRQAKTPRLYRNNLQGPLEEVGARVFPEIALAGARQVRASDLDRDGDLDLLVARDATPGLLWLDNLRQGRFAERTAAAGLGRAPAARAVAAADLDNDGRFDLVSAGATLAFWHNRGGRFERWQVPHAAIPRGEIAAVVPFDADNDGRLDLAVGGAGGLAVLLQRPGPRFSAAPLAGAPAAVAALAAADLDGDGDLDLLAAGRDGLTRLDNRGGDDNHWLRVRLTGLAQGNSKNNVFGYGSTVEVFAGAAYQLREADGDVVHFGLGDVSRPDMLRVVWTNGVPQNRLRPEPNQQIVEEQLLKGSCPFLYAWDGERYRFVTDLLWSSPLGLPLAPSVWAGADPEELVKVEGVPSPADGRYRLVVTEELWEAAFFDHVRLWVVDHPAAVEVASSLKILPGETVPDRVLGSRELSPVTAAWDGSGREVTARLAARDDVYADGYQPSPYQGVAERPWALTFDLGEAPAGPVRLHLDGWIFPTDASLNLALAQRSDYVWMPPRLEVETAEGWQVLIPAMGFPAGKTKTMVVETPPLPAGARRLRIVTTLWLGWDRVAWSRRPADGEPRVVARLAPAVANLGFRGFSRMFRVAPNGPHAFDYHDVTETSPWLPFPGRYTRYGDVLELLEEPDDRSVILGPGDALELVFDAAALPAPPVGWRRTVFLESHGWDKDADRNTYQAQQLEPLPFRAMSGYPYRADERFPDTPRHRRYLEQWLTREVRPAQDR